MGDGSRWAPMDDDNRFLGPITLRYALAQSRNVVAVKLAQDLGIDRVVEYAHRMGVTAPLDPTLSLALGSSGVSPLDQAAGYATLANQGVHIAPSPIRLVRDSLGTPMLDNTYPQQTEVVSAGVAYVMTSMLESVINEGTGYPNADIGRPAAGKTGTTSSFRDAWFVGYTPDLVAAVWIGNDDYSRMNESYGGNIPARIWARFMKTRAGERQAARLRAAGRRGAQSQAVQHRQGRGVPGRHRARAHLRHARRHARPRRTGTAAAAPPRCRPGTPPAAYPSARVRDAPRVPPRSCRSRRRPTRSATARRSSRSTTAAASAGADGRRRDDRARRRARRRGLAARQLHRGPVQPREGVRAAGRAGRDLQPARAGQRQHLLRPQGPRRAAQLRRLQRSRGELSRAGQRRRGRRLRQRADLRQGLALPVARARRRADRLERRAAPPLRSSSRRGWPRKGSSRRSASARCRASRSGSRSSPRSRPTARATSSPRRSARAPHVESCRSFRRPCRARTPRPRSCARSPAPRRSRST